MGSGIWLIFYSDIIDVLDSFHYKCENIIYENDTMRSWGGSNIDT